MSLPAYLMPQEGPSGDARGDFIPAPASLSSQALLSRCLGAEELGPWLPRFSSHRAAPVGVTSSDQRAAPRPRVTRGAAGWSVLSGCPSHRHEGEGKLLVALTLNRDLDRRRGFRGSCPPGLSGTGWGLFPRPAHVAGVGRGGWGGQALNKPEQRAWPRSQGELGAPEARGPRGGARPCPRVLVQDVGVSHWGPPAPLAGTQSGITRINCPGQSVQSSHKQ